MGKLASFYTKVERNVEFELPLSGDKMAWHRPSNDEVREIMKYGETLDLEDADAVVKMSAMVLKVLCEKPDLSEESQTAIEKDILSMDAPDRNSILMYFNELMGVTAEDVDRFTQRTRK